LAASTLPVNVCRINTYSSFWVYFHAWNGTEAILTVQKWLEKSKK
jgi:hypothetical protein